MWTTPRNLLSLENKLMTSAGGNIQKVWWELKDTSGKIFMELTTCALYLHESTNYRKLLHELPQITKFYESVKVTILWYHTYDPKSNLKLHKTIEPIGLKFHKKIANRFKHVMLMFMYILCAIGIKMVVLGMSLLRD